MPTLSEAGRMIVDAYGAVNDANGQPVLQPGYTAPNDWTLVKVFDNTSQDGDAAAIFVNNTTNEVFIAGRGTATLHDALPDAGIAAGFDPSSRIADAKNILAFVQNLVPGATITAGGHSLDGEVWAKVSEDQQSIDPNAPLYVLALNAPNSFGSSSFDGNVLHINAQYDGVGHWGADYTNFITLDSNPSFGLLNQFGDQGTHSAEQLVFQGIDKNSALANSELGQSIDIQGVIAGGNVTTYQVPGFNGDFSNDSVSVVINPDGSMSEVVTTYFSDGTVKSVRTINIEADGDGASTIENGQGQVISTETLDVDSDAHTQFFDSQNFDSDGELQSEGTFSVVANGEAFANIKGQGFETEVNDAIVNLAPDTEATVSGDGNIFFFDDNASGTVVGQTNTFLGDAGSSYDVAGDNNTFFLDEGQSATISGNNEFILASGGNLTFAAGASGLLLGQAGTLSGDTDGLATVEGLVADQRVTGGNGGVDTLPRGAAELISTDDGTITVNEDGTRTTTGHVNQVQIGNKLYYVGNVSIIGGQGPFTEAGGTGRSLFIGLNGNNHFDAGLGDNVFIVVDGNNVLLTSETIRDTDAYVQAGNGDNRITAVAFRNVIQAGNGNNDIFSTGVHDIVQAGDGDNSVSIGSDEAKVVVGNGDNHISVSQGSNLIVAGNGTNRIETSGSNNTISVGNGINTIAVASGDNLIRAGAGQNAIALEGGKTTVFGGQGSDVVYLGGGEQTIILGSGLAPATNLFNALGTSGSQPLQNRLFQNVVFSPDHITSSQPGDTVIVGGVHDDYIEGGWGNTRIDGGAGNDFLVGDVAIGSATSELIGGSGDDVLKDAFNSPDSNGHYILNGGSGNDLLIGGFGWDTFVFGRGYGNDTISDYASVEGVTGLGRSHTIQFLAGIAPSDVTLRAQLGPVIDPSHAGDLVLDIQGTSDSLTIDRFVYSNFGRSGQQVTFADGTVWDLSTMINQIPGVSLVGTAGSDRLQGTFANDVLTGGAGDDELIGDAGADTLAGGLGNDTYVFNLGDGRDVIQDTALLGVGNRIQFGAGITQSDLTFTRDDVGHTLTIDVGNGGTDRLLLENFDPTRQNGSLVAMTLSFDDGTYVDTETLYSDTPGWLITDGDGDGFLEGSALADTLVGGRGNDYLAGGAGSDSYLFALGDGIDTIQDTNGSIGGGEGGGSTTLVYTNTIVFGQGIAPSAVTLALDPQTGSLLLTYGTQGDQIYLSNFDPYSAVDTLAIQAMTFADGTSWDTTAILDRTPGLVLTDTTGGEYIQGSHLADTLSGSHGSNTLDGGERNDRLFAGPGNLLLGGAGNDTYFYNLGDGFNTIDDFAVSGGENHLQFGVGITQNDLSLTRDQMARTLTIQVGSSGADQLVLLNFDPAGLNGSLVVATLAFADGSTVNLADLLGGGPITGTAGDDVLTGTTGDDVINALAGNDTITGLGGADTIDGGAGNDLLDGGAGADTLLGGLGDDTYVIDDAGDVVTENLNEGIDTVQSGLNYTLGANVENLTLTGRSSLTGTGNALNNSLTGNSGDNVLDGGAGGDMLVGGTGNDSYIVDNVGDVITEQINEGTDTVQSSVSYTLSANVENLILTGPGNLTGTGNTLDNALTGTSGDNTLDGQGGADTLIGGLGNDTYVVDNVGDVVTEQLNEGTDTVQASISYALGTNVENLTLTGSAAINGTGNALDNVLTGNSASNTLTGGAGNDTYVVSTGDMVIEAANQGLDQVLSDSTWTLGANLENLTLTGTAAINGTGNSLNNILTGNSASNVLNGGVGADTLLGGQGNDIYVVDNVGDVVTEQANEGTDLIQSTVTYSLGANVENLTLTGAAAINATGNGLNNTLTGNSAANVLAGGAGNDLYVVGTGDTVIEQSDEGTDTVQSAITWTLGANIENLTLTGAAATNGTGNALNNVLTGNSAANTLDGGAGDDTLSGGAGADTLVGGLGNDTYIVDNVGDVMTELLNEGTDRVQSSVSYTLSANVENLTLTGAGALSATGNAGENVLTGNSGNNVLDGGMGADSLVGGLGNDTYVVDDIGDVVTENLNEGTDTVQASITYALGANVENLTLTGSGAINGTGNNANNVVIGNSAANVLDGGGGTDTLRGGLGDDTYVIDDAMDVVTENLNEGSDTVQAAFNYTLGGNVENLTLTGTGAINGTGNTLNNVLTGNDADNVLSGGAGADTLIGGQGDDIYLVDNAGDVISEQANEGTDLVQSSVSYSLSADVENLTLTGTAGINATGNSLNNILRGNAGANVLDGGTGADTLIGGKGNDTYLVDDAGDVVTENLNEGTDTVQAFITYTLGANLENLALVGTSTIDGTGNALNNVLTGNNAANVLTSGDGNDTLDGGAGGDTLIGGLGNDTYLVDDANDLVMEALNEGTDTVQSTVTYALGANVENLILTGSSALNGTGNALNNVLTGNSAANVLAGGAGNDTYVVSAGDSLIEHANEGTDTVQSDVSWTLGANLENLTLLGTTAISGIGNAFNNVLRGNSAANILAGGLGNDTYVASTGDTIVENSNEGTDTVQSDVSWTLGANLENLTLTGITASNGTGNSLSNTLTGNAAANQLTGGTGNDTLRGGLGNDTYLIARGDGQDVISENDSTSGNSDTLLYETMINPLDLVISRQVNDLRLSVHGSTDTVTIQNWYSAPTTAQLETIQAGNGQTLLNTQVDQLIQAMASFSQQTGLTWDQAIDQRPQEVQTVLAANWH